MHFHFQDKLEAQQQLYIELCLHLYKLHNNAYNADDDYKISLNSHDCFEKYLIFICYLEDKARIWRWKINSKVQDTFIGRYIKLSRLQLLLEFIHKSWPIGFPHLLQKDIIDFIANVDLLGWVLSKDAAFVAVECLIEAG